jgi:hypothetical protein
MLFHSFPPFRVKFFVPASFPGNPVLAAASMCLESQVPVRRSNTVPTVCCASHEFPLPRSRNHEAAGAEVGLPPVHRLEVKNPAPSCSCDSCGLFSSVLDRPERDGQMGQKAAEMRTVRRYFVDDDTLITPPSACGRLLGGGEGRQVRWTTDASLHDKVEWSSAAVKRCTVDSAPGASQNNMPVLYCTKRVVPHSTSYISLYGRRDELSFSRLVFAINRACRWRRIVQHVSMFSLPSPQFSMSSIERPCGVPVAQGDKSCTPLTWT